jgi:hypothetical protein
MADTSRAQPDSTNAAEPPAVTGSPPVPSGHRPAWPGPPSPGATAVQPSTGADAPSQPEAKLRRLARSALVRLVVAWLAAAVAVLVAVPDGFGVTRWWAYGFALLALNTALAVLVLVTGDGLRHLLLGADHRLSTSKTQVAAWTYLVVFALSALMLMASR